MSLRLSFIGPFILLIVGLSCKKDIPAPLPIANFFVENNNCTSLCDLYFTSSAKNAVRWQWNFGNGIQSTQESDTIAYSVSGTYNVWFYVWNSDEVKDSIQKTVFIH